MKIVADQKRRVVLPKPAKPGDVFDCVVVGDRYVLVRLEPVSRRPPPVAAEPLPADLLEGIDLEAPAFPPLAE